MICIDYEKRKKKNHLDMLFGFIVVKHMGDTQVHSIKWPPNYKSRCRCSEMNLLGLDSSFQAGRWQHKLQGRIKTVTVGYYSEMAQAFMEKERDVDKGLGHQKKPLTLAV